MSDSLSFIGGRLTLIQASGFSEYPLKVLRLYLVLRAVFVAASFVVLGAAEVGVLDWGEKAEESSQLWLAFATFFGWSACLWAAAWNSANVSVRPLDRLILLSLVPDGISIYLAASATGGQASPVFHSVYLLIALHSYHLAFPVAEPNSRGSSLYLRYFYTGVMPSVLTAMVLYSVLTEVSLFSLNFWVEFGLQLLTALSFAWIGLNDMNRSSELTQKEEQLRTNQQELVWSSKDLEGARLDLEKAKLSQERLLQALGRVSNIAELKDEASLSDRLSELAEQIGRTLNVEYCAIGFARDEFIEDVAVWTSFPRSPRAIELLEKARVNPTDDSLIGSVIYKLRRPLIWDSEKYGDALDSNSYKTFNDQLRINIGAAESYREILPDGKAHNMLIVPFYSSRDAQAPIGYLDLINRSSSSPLGQWEGFSGADAVSLMAIAHQLAIAIENFRSHRKEQSEREDEDFLRSIPTNKPIGDVFDEVLRFLNAVVGSRVASLWLPIEDGFGTPEEVRKLVLRSVCVSGPDATNISNSALESLLRKSGIQTHSNSYIGRYLDTTGDFTQLHYQSDLSGHPHCWSEHLEAIGAPRLLLIPIGNPLARESEAPPVDRLLAALCLRPTSEDFAISAALQERLRRFSQYLESLILGRRLERRFEQIRILQDWLPRLQTDDLRIFYQRLVSLVKDVMGAEACTIFLVGRSPTELNLEASTAKVALVDYGEEGEKEVAVASLVEQVIYETTGRSLTAEVLRQRKPVLVYNTFDNEFSSRRFLEAAPLIGDEFRSFIAAPILAAQRDLGVIRCVNQEESHRILPCFLPSEFKFFELLAGVISSFVEGAQAVGARRQFLREIVHEFATPLLQAQTITSFLELNLKRQFSNKAPTEIVVNLRETLSHLQALVRDIQFHFQSNSPKEPSYNWRAPVSIHKLVDQIRKPMLPVARQSRAVDITGHTSEAPELYVDRARFEQVLYNLIQNAVKYARYGGDDIDISYDYHKENIPNRREGRWHRFRVMNDGIGVPVGEEELIFREYVRGSNAQFVSTGQSGTGLGLSVARRIVERHGGILRLERRERPTIFAVLLPKFLERRGPSDEDLAG